MKHFSLWKRLGGIALIAAVIAVGTQPTAGTAASDKQLRRVRGSVAFQIPSASAPSPLFGRVALEDEAYAITQNASAAEVQLPDSSVVSLGNNTRVKVGAFSQGADGPGSTFTVDGGTVRFDVRRPAGGRANYHFATATSQIAVRGTVGVLSFIDGTTSVTCLQCAADSVTVTVGNATVPVLNGQTLVVSPSGGVVTGPSNIVTVQQYADNGVSTSSTGAAAGATTATVPIVAAGLIASSVVLAAKTPSADATPFAPFPTPTPLATATPRPTPTPTSTPTPVATPTATPTIPGTINVTGHREAATPSAGSHR